MASNEKKETKYEKVPSNETKEGDKDNGAEENKSYGFGVRHMQALLIFTCLIINFIARGHLGVTIVAMVDIPTNDIEAMIYNDNNTIINNVFESDNTVDTEMIVKNINVTGYENIGSAIKENITVITNSNLWNVYRKYEWPKSVQEMVLGSFFVGYLIMMFPMGMIIQRWGGKFAMQLALAINGIVSILTPWIVTWGGWKGICLCRILQGLSQAGIYPASIALLAVWVPTNERASISSYVLTGPTVGTVIAFQLSGFISSTSWSWPSMFWMAGTLCLITFILITFFVSAYPQQHSFISDREKMYISGHLNAKATKTGRVPWKKALSSKHVWAIFAAHVGNGTTFVFIFTQVASYLHFILHVDVKKSGMLSSLPYVANAVSGIIFGCISDVITNRKIISIKTSRRLFNSIAAIGISTSLAAVSFTTSTATAVAWLILAMGSHAGAHTGWMVNYMDISPNFSGSLVGTGNTIMNVLVVCLPVIVSNIVTDVSNPYQWRVVLFLVAGFGFLCNVIFVVFVSTEPQPWNEPELIDDEEGKDERELADLKDLTVVPE